MENSPAGTEVNLTNPIAASDKDEGKNQNFTFALRGEGSNLFRIDPITGRVYFAGIDERTLDRESRVSYHLQVIATDNGTYTHRAVYSPVNIPSLHLSPFNVQTSCMIRYY